MFQTSSDPSVKFLIFLIFSSPKPNGRSGFQITRLGTSSGFQPRLKNMIVKLDDLPRVRGENKLIFQTNTYILTVLLVWSNNPPAQDSSGK